jgi:transposase
MNIVRGIRWSQREKLARLARKSRDSNIVRRSLAVSQLARGRAVSQVAESLCAARSTIYQWASWFREGGIDALCEERRGSARRTVTEAVVQALDSLLETTPQALGYLRSRWSSQLLAKELRARTGVKIHASTVRRVLADSHWVWRRARPTLHIADPRKKQRMRAIRKALASCEPGVEVFYQDEADIDLNPRIGPAWRRRGKAFQEAIPTPGKNRKAYLAGALHARTGKVVWVGGTSKNSALFIDNLAALERAYPKAKRLVLVLDNYAVHKSRAVNDWLSKHPKFQLLFQPAYHPWVNRIERLWKAMHDTVTRNHRCRTLEALCANVARFLDVVQPFPGAQHACATMSV